MDNEKIIFKFGCFFGDSFGFFGYVVFIAEKPAGKSALASGLLQYTLFFRRDCLYFI